MKHAGNVRMLAVVATNVCSVWCTETRRRFLAAQSVTGWTNDRTAAELGVTANCVSLWRCGDRKIPAWALAKIEDAAAERAGRKAA